MQPVTHYAKAGDVHIAYQVFGDGDVDLVFVPGFISHIDNYWDEPRFARWLRRMGTFARVILFDKRGTGLSDWVAELPGMDQRMDDISAVMEAVGIEQAAIFGISEGGSLATLFAATYPNRSLALILYGAFAQFTSCFPTQEALDGLLDYVDAAWGSGKSLPLFAPSEQDNVAFEQWWGKFERLGASPDRILDEMEQCLTGEKSALIIDRVLATVVFTDIVGSTVTAEALGDQAWGDLQDLHDKAIRRELARYRGKEIRWTGDGFLPTLRPLLLPRPRLLAKMDAGSAGKLTLISAPAGFGKTTLAAYWLASRESPVTWLSLDENDSQPLRFFTYLIAAMQTAVPGLAADLAATLRSPNPPDETAIVPALLNELSGQKEPFILVLDDYHLIANDAVHQALAFLIDQLPPALHLIITSREDPPLPLPRWRVRGQLSSISSADLRFTVDETAAFLQETMGLSLPSTAVADLEARTEGWAAALQLAALSLRGAPDAERIIASFSGSERQVAGYLLQEVLLQQPQAVQAFLLQTSILERFNAALCNALLERRDSQEILDQLEQNNLFTIPLDHDRFWYRYHHLFAELLRYRLRRDWPPDAIAALHRRASRWYAGAELLEEAIAHAFQIPDYDEVARLLDTLPMHTIFIDGGSLRLLQWAKKLPPDTVDAYPIVAALIAGAAMINGEGKIATQHIALVEADGSVQHFSDLFHSILVRNESADYGRALRLAQSALAGAAGEEDIFAPMAWAQIAVNFYNLGQLEEADEAIIAMRHAIPEEGLAAQTMQLQAIDLQVMTAVAQGSLQLAERRCREGIALAEKEGRPRLALIGLMFANLASITYQWNEIQRAEESVEIALIAAPPAARAVSAAAGSARDSFAAFWREWLAGLRLIIQDKVLTNIFAIIGVALFADAILSAVLAVFIQDDAGLNATQFGWLLAARGIGGLAGGLLLSQFGQKQSQRRLASFGLLATGLLILVVVFFPVLQVALIAIAFAGISAIAWMIAFQTMLQQNTSDAYRGRIFGAYGTTASLLMIIGSALAGATADWLGASALIIISALITIFAGFMAWALLRTRPVQETAPASI